MWILYILILLLMLGLLVLVHELGHFIIAKIFKVHIYEFSIGMGPLIKKHIGKDGIQYSIRALPIGGYVQMAGEVMEDDDDIKDKSSFMCNKPWWQRVLILIAGVTNNFITALVLLFLLAVFYGAPSTTPLIEHVAENSAYEQAGGHDNDLILKVNGKKVKTWDDTQLLLTLESNDNTYDIEVKSESGETKTLHVKPEKIKDEDGNERKLFGMSIKNEISYGFFSSLKYAGVKFTTLYKSMFTIIGSLFTGKLSLDSLSGPVGMYSIVEKSVALGLAQVIYLTAYISLNLGFMNLLPFPAFDGGHIVFILIEKIRGGKPINKDIEGYFHLVGFFLLMLLMIFITIKDIIKLF